MSAVPDKSDAGSVETPPVDELRNRLKFLTAIRCLMVTLLLGAAIAINVNDLNSFDHTSYRGLTAIIIATYVITLPLSIALRFSDRLLVVAHVSFAFDSLIALGLVLLTGGFESPFTYLFLLVGLYGGTLLGKAGGLMAASYAVVSLAALTLVEFDMLSADWIFIAPGTRGSPTFRALILGLATFMTGFLSGLLAERLEKARTELELTQKDVAALRNLNELILRSLSSGILTVDLADRIVYANPAAARLLERERARLEGMTLESIGLHKPSIDNRDERWEIDLVLPSGADVVFGLSYSTLHDEQDEPAGEIITFQDLTQLRRVEQQLRQQDRLATVGRFAAGIAHEIRNPLASISGSVEMLESSLDATGDDQALMRIIIKEIDRLNGLVQRILQYTGPHRVMRQPFNLHRLVHESARLFRNDEMASDIEFELDIPESLVALGDEESLRQILHNLWRNSAEAINGKGTIITSARVSHPWIELAIGDDGPGIPDSIRQSLFEPFHTTKSEGTGLGLATVYQLVTENGGSIVLDEEFSDGTRFLLRLRASESGSFPKVQPGTELDSEEATARQRQEAG